MASLTAAAVLLLALVASVAVIGYVSTSCALTEASRRAADAERESRHVNSLRLAGESAEFSAGIRLKAFLWPCRRR